MYQANYEKPVSRNVDEGMATLVWAEKVGKNPEGWAIPGGGRIKKKDDAKKYAIKLSNLIISLRGE